MPSSSGFMLDPAQGQSQGLLSTKLANKTSAAITIRARWQHLNDLRIIKALKMAQWIIIFLFTQFPTGDISQWPAASVNMCLFPEVWSLGDLGFKYSHLVSVFCPRTHD